LPKNDFALDKERRDQLVKKIRDRYEDIRRTHEEAVEEITSLIEDVNIKIRDYNEAVTEAKSFMEDELGEMQQTFDEKSEKWQEGDRGEEVQAYLNELERFDPEEMEEWDLELELPDFSEDDCPVADELEDLSEEA
jgi:gas vesicle protein